MKIDSQLEQNVQESRPWGSKAWFDHLFASQGDEDPSAYYAHEVNGYQIYRHRQLIASLKAGHVFGKRLLDIGCGSGALTHLISQELKFEKTVGIDFVTSLLKRTASHFTQIDFLSGALPRLPFQPRHFDLVVASEVLYYLSEADRKIVIDEIYSILKPGGFFLFSSVLGETYFFKEEAIDYVKTQFDIETYFVSHNRLYHTIFGPLGNAKRLSLFLRTGAEPGHEETLKRLQKWAWLFNNSLFILVLNLVCLLSSFLLRMVWIPRVLNWLSRLFLPGMTQTNITIIAKKR